MPAAQESIVINVPKEKFFEVITDFEKYPEFIPEMKAAKVIEHKDNEYVVDFTVSLIKKIDYRLKLVAYPYEKLEWNLVKGFFKKNYGYWLIKELGPEQIEATYYVELEMGLLVPKKLLNELAQVGLPGMLKRFKERAESLYRS